MTAAATKIATAIHLATLADDVGETSAVVLALIIFNFSQKAAIHSSLANHAISVWQARRESNPQPAVLETAALPIELLA